MVRYLCSILFVALSIQVFAEKHTSEKDNAHTDLAKFCEKLPRAAYSAWDKHETSNDWFEVYQVEKNIWAIYEPHQWQEVISYLIVGSKRAILFDTGNGIGNIKEIVDQLTDKKIIVLNSHSHFDHIGGNHLFDNIHSVATDFTYNNSHGIDNELTKTEVTEEALCKALPQGVSKENHRIKPFSISKKINHGDVIDLGDRLIEVIRVPGHTNDSIVLLDRAAGFMWTGDSFYAGPIWLYFPETDLAAYKKSLAHLVSFTPKLKALFPAHNTPKVAPEYLLQAQKAFDQVLSGQAKPTPTWEGVVTYEFEGFGFLMRENYTSLSDNK